MTTHKRTEITVETDRVLIIRRRRVLRAWCAECGCEVDVVGQEEAELLTGMRQLSRDCAQARGWHLTQGPERSELVCLESLLKSK
jgi:hypothetical protein